LAVVLLGLALALPRVAGESSAEDVLPSSTSTGNFFFEALPAGEHTLTYRLRADLAGEFQAGPATVQSMYAPEFVAYSGAGVIRVDDSK
jgi:hypothetical protein